MLAFVADERWHATAGGGHRGPLTSRGSTVQRWEGTHLWHRAGEGEGDNIEGQLGCDQPQQPVDLAKGALIDHLRRPMRHGRGVEWSRGLETMLLGPGFEQLLDQGLPGKVTRPFQPFNFLF